MISKVDRKMAIVDREMAIVDRLPSAYALINASADVLFGSESFPYPNNSVNYQFRGSWDAINC